MNNNEKKSCSKCKIEKSLTEFYRYKDQRYSSHCRECNKEEKKIFYANNKEKILARCKKYRKEYYRKNKERINLYNKLRHREKLKNPEYRKQKNENCRKRYQNPLNKITIKLGEKFRKALRHNQACDSTLALLGCSAQEFKNYLESKFLTEMSWENKNQWDMRFVAPKINFDLSRPEHQRRFFHYTNIVPIWNYKKTAFQTKVTSQDTVPSTTKQGPPIQLVWLDDCKKCLKNRPVIHSVAYWNEKFICKNCRTNLEIKKRQQQDKQNYFKIRDNLRDRLGDILRRMICNKNIQKCSRNEMIGCSSQELKLHLENQFQEGMTWENYGGNDYSKRHWHVDHIKPLSLFDLSNSQEQIKANHYTNLQPLWSIDNLIKSNKYEPDDYTL